MTATQNVRNLWFDMSLPVRISVSVILVIIAVLFVGSMWTALRQRVEILQLERVAAHAEADKAEALSTAAKVAGQIREREIELNKKEEGINEEYKKLEGIRGSRVAAERNAERQRNQQRTIVPTPDELCRILANSGHPCK